MSREQDDIFQKRLDSVGPVPHVSALCIGPDRLPVIYAVRATPKNVSESGWILASGAESREFRLSGKNYRLVPLESIINDDSTLSLLLDSPIGTAITHSDRGSP